MAAAKRTTFDWMLEALACFLFLAIVGIVATNWSNLPATVPIHFNALGNPDRVGGRGMVWLIPLVAAVQFVLLTVVSQNTRLINLPVAVDRSAPEVQALLLRLTLVLKIVFLVTFLYIAWSMVKNAQGHAGGIGMWFLPVSTATIFLALGFYLRKLRRYQK